MATPDQIIADQQAYASQAISDADSFLNQLNDIASSTYYLLSINDEIPEPEFEWDTIAEIQNQLTQYFPGDLSVPDISAVKPTYDKNEVVVDPMPDITVPEFTSVPPVLSLPETPDTALPVAPSAPTISDPVLPDVPPYTLPTAPELTRITFPDVPVIEIPEFDVTPVPDDLITPTNNFEFHEVEYQSALLDALKAKLLSDMENGGYGIEPADEAGLWDRARGRELEAALMQSEDLVAQAASRGFPLPPGDMNVILQRAEQELQNKMSDVNRDIMLKRGDLYVQNRQFTIQQTKALEDTLIGYHSSMMERSLNAAKAILDAAIQVYNAQVARFNARLAKYQAEATVFESRIRAALAHVEIYKVQMEGKRLELEADKTLVETYVAQLQAVNTVMNIYKTQVEAAGVKAEIEQLRLQAFRALVDAYTSQVQAKVAEFGMYEAQIRGETAKVQTYATEAQAYSSVVAGKQAQANVYIAKMQGQINLAQNLMEQFKTEMDGYRIDVGAQAQTTDAKVNVYQAKTQAGSAKSTALAKGYDLDINQKDLALKRNIENARNAIEGAKLLLAGLVQASNIRLGAANASSQYYTSLVGGAVNSINTLAAAITNA